MLFLFVCQKLQEWDMHSSFAGKKILIGVTGSIAAFKVAGWVSTLAKAEAEVSVIMTRSAREFVSPLTFSALSGNSTYGEMFAEGLEETMHHITLGRDADLVIVAPATAGTIARLAAGMADDLLTRPSWPVGAGDDCPAMKPHVSASGNPENIARLNSSDIR
jgi:phosphopantothenoylcysteine decarboxylase/phosphopantothenate--cysteine ligase